MEQKLKNLENEGNKLKGSLLALQSDLDAFIKATEAIADNKEVPLRFFNRVNVGEVTSNFSELCKSIFDLEEKLKLAISQAPAIKEVQESPSES